MGEEKRMKVKLYFLLHMGFIAIFLLLPVCEAGETQWSVEPGTILSTATKDFQLNSQDELVQYLSTAPRSTPYLDKIELRTETEDFDPENGHLEAEGAMIFIELDYSLYNLGEEDNGALLQIERELMNVVLRFISLKKTNNYRNVD